jgi:hypothetical protein
MARLAAVVVLMLRTSPKTSGCASRCNDGPDRDGVATNAEEAVRTSDPEETLPENLHVIFMRVKIVEVVNVISNGSFPQSVEWARACADSEAAIEATDWPHGTGKFTIYPESGKKRGKGNGVVPIKIPCIKKLVALGWERECLPPAKDCLLTTGDLDVLLTTEAGCVGFEWETGNISSSHRALNKLTGALMRSELVGGILVVPSDKLKVYLTDRIGNIGELRPYFPLWSAAPVKNGALRIIVVEHDATDMNVPRIPKMTAGRALQ